MARLRWLVLVLLVACGGRLAIDLDAAAVERSDDRPSLDDATSLDAGAVDALDAADALDAWWAVDAVATWADAGECAETKWSQTMCYGPGGSDWGGRSAVAPCVGWERLLADHKGNCALGLAWTARPVWCCP